MKFVTRQIKRLETLAIIAVTVLGSSFHATAAGVKDHTNELSLELAQFFAKTEQNDGAYKDFNPELTTDLYWRLQDSELQIGSSLKLFQFQSDWDAEQRLAILSVKIPTRLEGKFAVFAFNLGQRHVSIYDGDRAGFRCLVSYKNADGSEIPNAHNFNGQRAVIFLSVSDGESVKSGQSNTLTIKALEAVMGLDEIDALCNGKTQVDHPRTEILGAREIFNKTIETAPF